MSLTFDPAASPSAPPTLGQAADEVSRRLEGLASALGSCAVTVLGLATAAQIAAVVRGAFDPAALSEVSRTEGRALLVASTLARATALPAYSDREMPTYVG